MSAPYFLAIDIGTSRTSAALARYAPDGSLVATGFPLGRSSDNAPTVAYAADGELLFGDAAERRGHTQPERLIREYKRRIGDDVPILAGEGAYPPEELYARTVDWAARAVIEREGEEPAGLAITVPAAWGDYRSGLVRQALAAQGWRDVVVMSEPEAAARHYEATNPLEPGRVLAVYDFGGGTFDAVVLRKEADGVRILGAPTGIPDLGGADFDDRIVRHAVQVAHIDAAMLAGDTAGRMGLAALRRECVDAKESLSFDSEAVIPVLVGGEQRSVRLSRDEFEVMISDDLERTVDAFQDALDDAGVDLDEVDAILLTGGTSRIPRVAQLMSERFDRPIAIDADPKAIIALGAARAAADAARVPVAVAAEPEEADDAAGVLALLEPPTAAAAAAAAPRRRWFHRVPAAAYVTMGAAVLLTGAGLVGAPALGTAIVGGAERAAMTGAPVAAEEAAGGEQVAAAPVVDPVAEAPSGQQDAQQTTPRRTPAKAPVTPTAKPRPAEAPKSTPAGSKPASDTATKPGQSQSSSSGNPTSTGNGGTSDPDPTTPPDPGPTTQPDPGPTTQPDPGPTTQPDPGPTTQPDPGPTTQPDPGPTTDPGPTDPAPSDPPPADPQPSSPPPSGDPAPEPTATV